MLRNRQQPQRLPLQEKPEGGALPLPYGVLVKGIATPACGPMWSSAPTARNDTVVFTLRSHRRGR